MNKKIQDIQSKIKENIQNNSVGFCAASSYFPLVGWIYPYFFRKDEQLAKFHGLQALQLNIVLIVLYFIVWFLESFPITAIMFGPDHIFHPISRTIWILIVFVYLSLTSICAYKAYSGIEWHIPYLKALLDKVSEYFNILRKKA